MSCSFPEGLSARPLTAADAEPVAELLRELEAQFGQRAAATAEELLEWWSYAELPTDSWCLERGGRLAAAAWVSKHGEGDAHVDIMVRPDSREAGIASALVEATERRARERGIRRLLNHVFGPDAAGRRLLERRGYRDARHFYEMVVDLDERPAEPSWPDEIRPESFRVEDARAFHTALGRAFENEWGFVATPFDEWLERRVENADTSLYFVARNGDELAAVVRNEPEWRGMGWVGAIGVLRPWRRRGLGRALLLHSLHAFFDRGIRHVGLGVDSENLTGAMRLYQSVGMRVTAEDVVYEKELG
jgi:mycothiol synthase